MIKSIQTKHERFFDEYVKPYDPTDPKIALKIEHTGYVVQAADQIAQSLALDSTQQLLVHAAALFHDIGRFEQVRRYHTFFDAKSVDHAALGASILKEEKILEEDFSSEQQAQIIEAVRVHSMLSIPAEHKDWQKTLDQIVRDADKIDIFRVAATQDPIDTSGQPLEAVHNATITPIVYESIMQEKSVLRSDRKTALDMWVSFLGFVFDLNFPKSAQLILEAGYWNKPLIDLLDQNLIVDDQTRNEVAALLEKTKQFLIQKSKAAL
ncbi:MAG: HD domain-containing protein [Erysipelotrichaceae bacterium]|nr:HD domain-containing protein [Erysipelotrichaceae bacterium]